MQDEPDCFKRAGFFLINRRAERTKELEGSRGRFMKVFPIKYHPGPPV
jgi:hypothetical protein